MSMRMLARTLAGMFPKALGQILTSVVAGICIAVATNWLLRTEAPQPPAQPVFVVERVAPAQDAALAVGTIRHPVMPLFLSASSLPQHGSEPASALPAHQQHPEGDTIARLPQAQIPEMRRDIEVQPLPPIAVEPVSTVRAQAVPASAAAQPQDGGFLGRHLPVAQRGIDLVQGETAAIVSVITSTLPFGAPGVQPGPDTTTSELY